MFSLTHTTDDAWAGWAVAHLDEILLEQAHLEKKAASAALNYLFRYPHLAAIQRPLSELAREELEHFQLMLGWLQRRGVRFGPQKASPYAARLLEVVRGAEPQRLLDSFLCSAVIEARSCERMKLLGEALADSEPRLAADYRELVQSEARHHGLYVRLAEGEFPRQQVRQRLAEITAHEAAVLASIPRQARLHT